MRNVIVLPAPLGPTTAQISPGSRSRLSRSMARIGSRICVLTRIRIQLGEGKYVF